ncbi:MAG: methyltransferase domain-containing protein [Anaerolineae bacterium]|nr:methyltransferase domain-containing protein [Anaerolineae bacterium]
MRKLYTWWIIITRLGSAMSIGRQVDQFFRYYVIEALKNEGLFDYLKQPRTYGQVLAQFGFVDSDYTREVFEILVADPANLLTKEDALYSVNSKQTLPNLEKAIKQTDKRVRDFVLMAQGMAYNVPARMRDEPIVLSESFEQDGRQLFVKFNQVLGLRAYSVLRHAAFAFLKNEERQNLQGRKLLDVGCAGGRETAELWLKLKGNVRITAIDPIAPMIELAEQSFETMIAELEPSHAPLSDANQPNFRVASATNLPFEDCSFDAAFYSLMLHWTPDPRRAIREIVRVVKPGGVIFGCQGYKPQLNPYFDIVIRTNRNCHGFFWLEEYRRWYAEVGLDVEMGPAGIFRAAKPDC